MPVREWRRTSAGRHYGSLRRRALGRITLEQLRPDERLDLAPHRWVVLDLDMRLHKGPCEPRISGAGYRISLIGRLVVPQDGRLLRIRCLDETSAMQEALCLIEV